MTDFRISGRSPVADGVNAATHKLLLDSGSPPYATLTPPKLSGVLNVQHYGAVPDGSTDSTSAIQAALDAALDGSVVFFPGGVYVITAALLVPSNITLLGGGGVSIKRGASGLNNMLRNGATDQGAYGGNTGITIENLAFDIAGSVYSTQCTAVAFGHCTGIRVIGCSFDDGYDWHGLELNACQDVIVDGCRFNSFSSVDENEEMLQLDLMKGSGQWPWDTGTTVYDDTPCVDVLITGCKFYDGATAIGTHSTTPGNTHKRITISDCHFTDMDHHAIRSPSWEQVIVAGCHFYDLEIGIEIASEAGEPLADYTISRCSFEDVSKTASTGRAIHLEGQADGTGTIRRISISDINILTCSRHGIGIDYCDEVAISNVHVNAADQVGVFIYRTNKATVQGVTCVGCGAGTVSAEDITVGSGAVNPSGGNDTEDVVVMGCCCEGLQIRGETTRTRAANNVLSTVLDIDVSAAEARTNGNWVSGTWTP